MFNQDLPCLFNLPLNIVHKKLYKQKVSAIIMDKWDCVTIFDRMIEKSIIKNLKLFEK